MKPKPYGIIYLLIDGVNDKEYIGQTTRSVKERFKEHVKCKNTYIGRAIKAHGKDMFVKVVLKECASREELEYWEKRLIKSRDTISPNGYNLTEGGSDGSMSCDKSRAKISASRRNNDSPFKNLTCEMEKNKLSFRGLAKLLGLSHTALSAKIYGKQNFTNEYIAKLVEIFNKPVEYLLWRDEGKSYAKPLEPNRAYSPYKNLLSEIESRQILYTELAEILKISLSSFSRKMLGKYKFTDKIKTQLAEIFDKPIDYLFWREDEEVFLAKKYSGSPFKNLTVELYARRLSYTELAKLLDLSPVTVSCKINGNARFTDKDVTKLVEIFDKPAEYLMKHDDGLPAISSKADVNAKISARQRIYSPFKNLLSEIEKHRLTYATLAKILGFKSMVSVSNKMRGITNFTAKDIAKLVEIFGKPAEYLMAREEN